MCPFLRQVICLALSKIPSSTPEESSTSQPHAITTADKEDGVMKVAKVNPTTTDST